MAIGDPRDIDGLQLWCSAKATTGLSDNDSVSTWEDISGQGNDLVASGTAPKWRSAGSAYTDSPITLQFNANGQYTLPSALRTLLATGTAAEMLILVKDNATQHSLHLFGNAAQSQHYPWSDGVVYEPAFSTSRYSFTPTISLSSTMRRYNIFSGSGTWRAFLDGTAQIADQTGNTYSVPPTMQLGTGHSQFNGWVSGIIIYNRKLTTTERSDLDAWAASNLDGGEYFVPSEPPDDPTAFSVTAQSRGATLNWTPSTGYPEGYRYRINGGTPVDIGDVVSYQINGLLQPSTVYTFELQAYNVAGDSGWVSDVETTTAGINKPTDISGCVLWISADQQNSADGATITTITDRSGQGNHLTTAGSCTFRTTGGRNGGPRFAFSNAYCEGLALNGMSGAVAAEYLASLRVDISSGYSGGLMLCGTSTNAAQPRYPYVDTDPYFFSGWYNPPSGTFVPLNSTVYNNWKLLGEYAAASDHRVYWEGSEIHANGNSFSGPNTLQIGRDSVGVNMTASVGCIVMYNRKLTAQERSDLTEWMYAFPSGGGVGGNIKVYNGSSWVAKPVKYWNGSAWVTKPVKYWDGDSWVLTPY